MAQRAPEWGVGLLFVTYVFSIFLQTSLSMQGNEELLWASVFYCNFFVLLGISFWLTQWISSCLVVRLSWWQTNLSLSPSTLIFHSEIPFVCLSFMLDEYWYTELSPEVLNIMDSQCLLLITYITCLSFCHTTRPHLQFSFTWEQIILLGLCFITEVINQNWLISKIQSGFIFHHKQSMRWYQWKKLAKNSRILLKKKKVSGDVMRNYRAEDAIIFWRHVPSLRH